MPARVSLQDMQTVTDPQTQFDWALWLPSIPGTGFTTRDFTFRCTGTQIPAVTMEEFLIEAQGLQFQRPGRRIWDKKLDVTMFETRDGIGRKLSEGWLDYIRNIKENTGNFFADFSVTAELNLYDAPGNITQRIALEGFYPLSLGTATLDNTSTLLTYTANFSYDRTRSLPV